MTNSPSSSILLGSTGHLPFRGHFRLRIERDACRADLAGRIGHNTSPEEAWELACFIREAFQGAEGQDALSLTRSCWEQLLVLARPKLGPAEGQDLSLLIVAHDAKTSALSAAGLDGIWQVDESDPVAIAGQGTSEISHEGIPKLPPKVLNIGSSGATFFGACLKEGTEQPTRVELQRRTGVSP
jgi:hypothetical protein